MVLKSVGTGESRKGSEERTNSCSDFEERGKVPVSPVENPEGEFLKDCIPFEIQRFYGREGRVGKEGVGEERMVKDPPTHP